MKNWRDWSLLTVGKVLLALSLLSLGGGLLFTFALGDSFAGDHHHGGGTVWFLYLVLAYLAYRVHSLGKAQKEKE